MSQEQWLLRFPTDQNAGLEMLAVADLHCHCVCWMHPVQAAECLRGTSRHCGMRMDLCSARHDLLEGLPGRSVRS